MAKNQWVLLGLNFTPKFSGVIFGPYRQMTGDFWGRPCGKKGSGDGFMVCFWLRGFPLFLSFVFFFIFIFHSGRWNHDDINMFFSKTHGPRNAEIQVANVRVIKKNHNFCMYCMFWSYPVTFRLNSPSHEFCRDHYITNFWWDQAMHMYGNIWRFSPQ